MELAQKVIVENKPGADGNIAIQYVAQARSDGLTLLFGNPAVVFNSLITPLDFDPMKVLYPLAKVTEFNLVLLMSSQRPPNHLQEFIAWAKNKPDGLTCGGGGAVPTIACHMLGYYGQFPLTYVPYKGNAPALRDLMGGHLDIMFDVSNSAATQLGNSKVVALATTAENHSEVPFEHLPVLHKTIPSFKLASWQGVFAPVGVPAVQVNRLDRALSKVLMDPEVIMRMQTGGMVVKYESAQKFRKTLLLDRQHYEQVFSDLKMSKPL